jgi:SAM-dependent methyltransferase
VHAVDRSKRFLEALEQTRQARGLRNIKTYETDLNDSTLPDLQVDGAWVRWVFAFVKQPRTLLSDIARSIKPGGVLVLHEYFDYSTWQVVPKSLEVEEFVREVMKSWRDEGGEPNIGLDLPRWLNELGFSVKSLNPIIDVISLSNYAWQWLKTFGNVGLRRLVDLGRVSPERAQEIQKAFDTREADPNALMFTPGVLEIIAVR